MNDSVTSFLMEYRNQLRTNEFLRRRLEFASARCENMTARALDGMPQRHSGGGSKDGPMAEYADLSAQYQRGVEEAKKKREKLTAFIAGVRNPRYCQILTAVYVDGVHAKALAGFFKKSRSWCAHTKKCALQAAEAHYDKLFPK